jgi:hypothetical protein
MDEGIAKYTEALVSEKDKNHLATIKYLREGKLFPLEEMTAFHIGLPGLKTTVGYPAAGSYTAFLIEKYGLKRFKKAFIFEARPVEERRRECSWKKAYGKSMLDLDKEWLYWLGRKFKVDEKTIQDHLEQVEKKGKDRLSKKEIKISVEDLEKYVGSYLGKEMGRRVIIKLSEGRLVLTTPDASGFRKFPAARKKSPLQDRRGACWRRAACV